MLLGTTHITEDELRQCGINAERLRQLAVSKVPTIFRHIKPIVDNQVYYTATLIRSLYEDDYNRWFPLCNELLENIKITGELDRIVECSEVLMECNLEVMLEYLERSG